MAPSDALPTLQRLSTGVPGLDAVTRGGLFRGGVYMLVGRPGSGKTILASQICFHRAAEGESVLYVTLLTEAHGRLLANLQGLTFFDAARVGRELHFTNGYAAIAEGGLDGLLSLLRNGARERKAALLVIDGMVTVEALATSPTAYRKFIQELQSWSAMMGCTVLILTSAATDAVGPEHTMVDGIFELSARLTGMRTARELLVTKFRGSGYLEGLHSYRITAGGLAIYPRLEAALGERQDGPTPPERLPSGVSGLDPLLGGGLAPHSLTLALGPSGCGKTLLAMQFLAEGAARGEPGLFFGFFETPSVLLAKGRRLGFGFDRHVAGGHIHVEWQAMAETLLDELGLRLLEAVRRTGARRLAIDGLVGFSQSATSPERLGSFFAVLGKSLRELGVAAILTEESRELFVQSVEAPVPGISATFENIVFLRRVEEGARLLRLLSVLKTRDSAHDDRLFSFTITGEGMRVDGPFPRGEALLSKGRGEAGGPAGRAGGRKAPAKRGGGQRRPRRPRA